MSQEIGIYGLGVQGQSIAYCLCSKGVRCSVRQFMESVKDEEYSANVEGHENVGPLFADPPQFDDFVDSLSVPRKVLVSLKSDAQTTRTIERLLQDLEEGDIVIELGSESWPVYAARAARVSSKSLRYASVACGGGETAHQYEGSYMVSCEASVLNEVKPYFVKLAASVADVPCVVHCDGAGSSHLARSVHNGLEYAEMELLCEVYDVLRQLGLSAREVSEQFDQWNQTELSSYLLEISSTILLKEDEDIDGLPAGSGALLDKIADSVRNRGGGRQAVVLAAEAQVSLPTVSSALWMRYLSVEREARSSASELLRGPEFDWKKLDRDPLLSDLKSALYCARLCVYSQAVNELRRVSSSEGWELDVASLFHGWSRGSNLQSGLALAVSKALQSAPSQPPDLLLTGEFPRELQERQMGWRRIVGVSVSGGACVPALLSALGYFDSLRRARLPHNLIQAQRDFFGSHTFERTDEPLERKFHCRWTADHA